ncbi:uncharacterized protein TrAFT101_006375 [Trichoderma asperellum]|uniref:Glycoside hydrolase family 16 protein n=1 Tax=Trichoderma asperellum (strain ATCC 204424 / CBS 433.97 / NBRC 101777) TaxID=1042311 RepID=A0A2T3YQW8_TRIA4|nr:hypothetical protein M441DRAFT_63102 [Trichoderma asperellum CBS 433.97]PTB34970.1 hypothetical protein M441DRAFT_63102 [Trichoderma asperellum CBS 433.97]UKZ91395.1 hypothetical protein TrAFT101_006375 [Trichoderma asperellum]
MAPRLRVIAVLLVLQFISVLPNSVSAKDVISPWNDTATGFGPDLGLAETWNASFPLFESIKSLPTNNSGAAGSDGSNTGVDLKHRATKDFCLRFMPLDASITQGIYLSDNNGYKKSIQEQQRWQGLQVNSEGSMIPTGVNAVVNRPLAQRQLMVGGLVNWMYPKAHAIWGVGVYIHQCPASRCQ